MTNKDFGSNEAKRLFEQEEEIRDVKKRLSVLEKQVNEPEKIKLSGPLNILFAGMGILVASIPIFYVFRFGGSIELGLLFTIFYTSLITFYTRLGFSKPFYRKLMLDSDGDDRAISYVILIIISSIVVLVSIGIFSKSISL